MIRKIKINKSFFFNVESTINSNNKAKSIKLVLDKTSRIKLTGDSYVSSLDDSDTSYSNIDFNGYKLYVNGKAIYIPSTSKKEWGSHTDTRQYLIQRNHEISQKYQGGSSIASLAMQFSLSEKSIQRIVREGKRKSGKL